MNLEQIYGQTLEKDGEGRIKVKTFITEARNLTPLVLYDNKLIREIKKLRDSTGKLVTIKVVWYGGVWGNSTSLTPDSTVAVEVPVTVYDMIVGQMRRSQ